MNVLIVEDQYEKAKVYFRCLDKLGVYDIKYVSSAFEVLEACQSIKYDLLILDIQIPDRLGQDPNQTGGVDLLLQLEMDSNYFVPTHIVAATSYEESYEKFSEFFSRRGWCIILGSDDEIISSILTAKLKHSNNPYGKYDVAILTALCSVEQVAVMNLPIDWVELELPNDNNKYYSGEMTTNNGLKKKIITTCCPRMGIASSSAVTMKLLDKFRPDYIFMTGISAGIKGKVNIGDILIADPSWDWGSGKMTLKDGQPHFMSSPHQLAPNVKRRAKFKEMAVQRTYLDKIYEDWSGDEAKRPASPPMLYVGPVATGAVVIEDPAVVDLIVGQHRETIGVEMEGYGVMAATSYGCADGSTEAFVIKSVCDFANIEKNDQWQEYAAYTSSTFAYYFIRDVIYS